MAKTVKISPLAEIDILDIALKQVRILVGQLLHKLGLDHSAPQARLRCVDRRISWEQPAKARPARQA